MSHDIFISHSTKDSLLVDRICAALEKSGLTCWLAPRDIAGGESWDDAILRGLTACRLVLLVLSSASAASEQVKREMLLAMQQSKLILPIRIEDAAPGELTYILASIQWVDAFDAPLETFFPSLIAQAQTYLAAPAAPSAVSSTPSNLPAQPKPPAQPPEDGSLANLCASLSDDSNSGPVALESGLYILRSSDALLIEALERHDQILLVEGSQGMGKTSLMMRGVAHAASIGMTAVYTDLQAVNTADLQNISSFFTALAHLLDDELDIGHNIEDCWDPLRSPNANFTHYFIQQVVPKSSGHLFWVLDETDRLFDTAFACEVFSLFRSWEMQRSVPLPSHQDWKNFTLALTTTSTAMRLIEDTHQSAFNVGTWISLDTFTQADIARLNQLYGSPLASDCEISDFCQLLSGRPHLVRTGLYELSQRKIPFDEFRKQLRASAP